MVVALLDLDTLALLFVTASADESPAAANNAAEGEQTEEHDTGNGTNDDSSNGTGAETTATRASIIVTDRLAVLISLRSLRSVTRIGAGGIFGDGLGLGGLNSGSCDDSRTSDSVRSRVASSDLAVGSDDDCRRRIVARL